MMGLGRELDHDSKRILTAMQFWFFGPMTLIMLFVTMAASWAGFGEHSTGAKVIAFIAYCSAIPGALAVWAGVRYVYHRSKS